MNKAIESFAKGVELMIPAMQFMGAELIETIRDENFMSWRLRQHEPGFDPIIVTISAVKEEN